MQVNACHRGITRRFDQTATGFMSITDQDNVTTCPSGKQSAGKLHAALQMSLPAMLALPIQALVGDFECRRSWQQGSIIAQRYEEALYISRQLRLQFLRVGIHLCEPFFAKALRMIQNHHHGLLPRLHHSRWTRQC